MFSPSSPRPGFQRQGSAGMVSPPFLPGYNLLLQRARVRHGTAVGAAPPRTRPPVRFSLAVLLFICLWLCVSPCPTLLQVLTHM